MNRTRKPAEATATPNEHVPNFLTGESAVKKSAMAVLRAKANSAAVARKAAGLSARKNPIERAKEDPTSKTKAIAAKCFDCEGQDADPCVSWRIGNCTAPNCGLFPVRPHQRLHGKPTPKALLEQFDTPAPLQPDQPVRATGGRRR